MLHVWLQTRHACKYCGAYGMDIHDAISLDVSAMNCPGVFSCCGGKSGGAKWNNQEAQWVCKDCGTPQSNDPSYLYSPGSTKITYNPDTIDYKPKCECGSTAVGSDRHADYCPLYKANP